MAGIRAVAEHGTVPVRYWVIDGWCTPPVEPVPPAEWPGWEARYDNDVERGKRTTRRVDAVYRFAKPWARLLTAKSLGEWSERLGYLVSEDLTWHGGGLHVTAPGGFLGCHLDYDRHPVLTDKRRALNLIAFLHPRWEPGWGGQFYLADPMGAPTVSIDPVPGRLVAFEVGDLSYHGVLPVTGPADRVSVAVYYLSAASEANTRRRALFLPARRAAESL